jgi:hypothetical protein
MLFPSFGITLAEQTFEQVLKGDGGGGKAGRYAGPTGALGPPSVHPL